jgi:cob(I)alamin adenosyltransferase
MPRSPRSVPRAAALNKRNPARTVIRRAERLVSAFAHNEPVNL